MVGEKPNRLNVAAHSKVLECAYAYMAGSDTRQHGSRKNGLAGNWLACGDRSEGASGRNAQCRHRLTKQIFAEYGTKCSSPVSTAGEPRATSTLQLNVAPQSTSIHNLAEQDGTPVAKLRHEVSELVSGIGLGDRLGSFRDHATGQHLEPCRAPEPSRVETKLGRELFIDLDQSRGGAWQRTGGRKEPLGKLGVAVIERNSHRETNRFQPPKFRRSDAKRRRQ
jgi:hypothetical protein